MKTFEMSDNSIVKLSVKISSEAIVGSHIKLDKELIKKSSTYNYNIDLGNSKNLIDKNLNVVLNCFVQGGNFEIVMNNTIVDFQMKDDNNTKEFIGEKIKITDDFFIIIYVVKLIKEAL